MPFYRTIQPFLIAVFVLGCLGTLIFMYFKPSADWLSGPVKATTAPVKEIISLKTDKNVTTVLLWFWPFGLTFEVNVCSAYYGIEGCFITTDRNYFSEADAVVIHHRDISPDLSNLPQQERPLYQMWVWFNMENPSYSDRFPGMDDLFNLTLNYRLDADIPMPHLYLVPEKSKEDFVPPSKDKLVCWIVSNWKEHYIRVKYFNELSKHITITTFGRGFGNYHYGNALSTMASCKFYLSFENCIFTDYITEKLYNPLAAGTVPVVLGTHRENYEKLVLGDSFIHVDDFASPKELADYLLYLDKHDDMYRKYFQWRKHYKVRPVGLWSEPSCQACDYIRRRRQFRVANNLNKWYWGY